MHMQRRCLLGNLCSHESDVYKCVEGSESLTAIRIPPPGALLSLL